MYCFLPCIIRKIQTKEVEKDGEKIPMITVQFEQESIKQNGESYIELGSMSMPQKYRKAYEGLIGKPANIPCKAFSPKDSQKVYYKYYERKDGGHKEKEPPQKDQVPF